MTVRISAPNVTLVNQSDATKTLTLFRDSPGDGGSDLLGRPGITFPIGGSITVSSTTAGGTYAARSTSPSIIEPAGGD